jgi:hypothetical protein
MPKDITHWLVAGRTMDLLRGTGFGQAVQRCPNACLVGAVLPDALYYLTGSHPKSLIELPDFLHGMEGEDTFQVLAWQTERVREAAGDPGERALRAALLAGIVTHIVADVHMHPLVFFHTGNYYAKAEAERTRAVRRHRALESLMDMHLTSGVRPLADWSLKSVLALAGREGDLASAFPTARLAEAARVPEPVLRQALDESFKNFAFMQSLYAFGPLAWLAREISPVLPDKAREIAALFYSPQLRQYLPAVSGRIEYRNPVSGQALAADLRELCERSAAASVELLGSIEPAVFGSARLSLPGYGPSLNTGLPKVTAEAMRHFAPEPLFPS